MATATRIGKKARSVKSDDPRKPGIVAALKKLSGASRVTSVVEMPDGTFRGNCLKARPGERGRTDTIGLFSVMKKKRGYGPVETPEPVKNIKPEVLLPSGRECPRCGKKTFVKVTPITAKGAQPKVWKCMAPLPEPCGYTEPIQKEPSVSVPEKKKTAPRYPPLKGKMPGNYPFKDCPPAVREALLKLTGGKKVSQIKLWGIRCKDNFNLSVRGEKGILVTENRENGRNVLNIRAVLPDEHGLINTRIEIDRNILFTVRSSPLEILGYKSMPRNYYTRHPIVEALGL